MRYLDRLRALKSENAPPPPTDKTDKTPTKKGSVSFVSTLATPFFEISKVFHALEARCPEVVPEARWRQAVADGQHFLARWGEQAHALGWTARDLFGLHQPPAPPHPSYSRLSRYDEIGLIWLLRGREVVALTEATAAIQNPTNAITIYRRHNKPALGPVGDCLDDFS